LNDLLFNLQEMVFKKDSFNAKLFFEEKNLRDYIYSNDLVFEEWFSVLLYASMIPDYKLLKDMLEIVKQKDLKDFQECVFNHHQAFNYYIDGNNVDAINSIKKSLNYLEEHRQKVSINNTNYGRDYKAMVYNSLGFILWKNKQFYDAKYYVKLAADIFGYKTKNTRREHGCLLLLSSIETTLANYSLARQYLRKIERKNTSDISVSINISLIYLFYLEENYAESIIRIKKINDSIENYSYRSQFNYYVKSALVYFAQKNYKLVNEFIGKAFLIMDESNLFNSTEKKVYKQFYEIITCENPESNKLDILKNEIIPYFVENGLINYCVLGMKYLERVR